MPTKKKQEEATKLISVRLPVPLVEKIDALCKKAHMSRVFFLRVAAETAVRDGVEIKIKP